MAKENKTKTEPERRILIVDDDRDDLATAGEAFRELSGDRWEIHLATGVTEALAVLQADKIALVVLAVNTPVLDVALLLGGFGRQHPRLKKVILAHPATDEVRAASLAAGADLFFEKPVSPEALKSVFERLGELLGWTSPPGFQGILHSVGLADLVQMECLGRESSVLELFHEQPLGRIYIEEGLIIHAVCGEMSGERAFHKLLALTGGTFELRDFELPAERTINRTWEFLLGEAQRQRELSGQRVRAGENFSNGENGVSSEPSGQASEILICSAAGEVLLNWQCAAPAARVTLMQNVAQQAGKLIPDLQLGKLDRVEIQLAGGRAILQPRADRLVFARIAAIPRPA
jgi:CheY-like chemotaxis protein